MSAQGMVAFPSQPVTVIVVAPHVCVEPEPVDPACDARSLAYATWVAGGLAPPRDVRVRVSTILSETPRRVLDNNRDVARGKTPLRKTLAEQLRELAPGATGAPLYVLEVHTFKGGDFCTRKDEGGGCRDARFVVLEFDERRSGLDEAVVEAAKKVHQDVAVVEASEVNSIGREVRESGVRAAHTLLEVRQDTDRDTTAAFAAALRQILLDRARRGAM